MGQRYTPDAHVFSSVVDTEAQAPRMLPDPLDVGFAIFENPAALPLLDRELEAHPQLAPKLDRIHRIVQADTAYWDSSLYARRLEMARALSGAQGRDAWRRRILNTQLAAWAEARQDTILFAKQSYTAGILCTFPDAYVEPVPAFWDEAVAYGRAGLRVINRLPAPDAQRRWLEGPFLQLVEAATVLGEMARLQEAGERFEKRHLAFVNQAVRHLVSDPRGCGGPEVWVGGLVPAAVLRVEARQGVQARRRRRAHAAHRRVRQRSRGGSSTSAPGSRGPSSSPSTRRAALAPTLASFPRSMRSRPTAGPASPTRSSRKRRRTRRCRRGWRTSPAADRRGSGRASPEKAKHGPGER